MLRLAPVTNATRTDVSDERRGWVIGYCFFEKLFCKQDGGHCIWPTGIEGQMSDSFDQLFLLDSIFHVFPEIKQQLVGTIQRIQRDQRRHGVRLRSRLDNSLRSQTSSNSTRSVVSTSFGEKSPINFLAPSDGFGISGTPYIKDHLGHTPALCTRCPTCSGCRACTPSPANPEI